MYGLSLDKHVQLYVLHSHVIDIGGIVLSLDYHQLHVYKDKTCSIEVG